jgi:hypothetical protein
VNAVVCIRTSHSHGELRRTTKRSVAPEISDNVVRAVRAMNEALKQERSRSKEHEPRRVLSSDSLSSTAQQESGEVRLMTFSSMFGWRASSFQRTE